MSIESMLTRELEIRFIDARSIATEAKLNLGIDGYPSEDQLRTIQEEAIRIFAQEKTERERMGMRILNTRLNSIKSSSSSSSSSGSDSEEETASSVGGRSRRRSSVMSEGSTGSTGSRKMKIGWPVVRRR